MKASTETERAALAHRIWEAMQKANVTIVGGFSDLLLVAGHMLAADPESRTAPALRESPAGRFRVMWEIDLDAADATEAAALALAIQRDPDSEALSFTVEDSETGASDDIDFWKGKL